MRCVRSTANSCVGAAVYRKCVKEWLLTPTISSLRSRVGPRLTKDLCGVTPSMIQRVSPLVISLIDEGCTSGVIQATKLEQSVLSELPTNEVLAGSAELDSLAHDFTCHMQAIFLLLRAMRAEDLSASGPRKYPKTGGFRRRLASADWDVLHPILKQIEVPSDTQREELVDPVDPFNVLDTDSGGFPTVFCRALSNNVSRVRSSRFGIRSTLASVKSDVLEPSTDTDIRLGQCEADNMDDDGSDDLQALEDRLVAITPKTRKRKAAAKAQQLSSKKVAKRHNGLIQNVRLAMARTPGAERAELTATIDGRRAHVVTLHKKSWCARHPKDAQTLKSMIEEKSMTKA